MALLVLDTATEVLATGLFALHTPSGERSETASVTGSNDSIELIASSAARIPRGHSIWLQPAMDQLLRQSDVSPQDLTAIGVGVGPGSYTGVRLGVSTAKAMAYALGIPLYPLSTLASMAAAANPGSVSAVGLQRRVLSLLYARRGRAFGSVFEQHGSAWVRVTEDKVQTLSDWMGTMAEIRRDRGDLPETLVHDFRPQYHLDEAVSDLSVNRVTSLAACAGNLAQGLAINFATGNPEKVVGENIHTVQPTYALEVEAEVKLKEAAASGHGEK